MSDSLAKKFQEIDILLKDARRVLVASHQRPDPDAVSSVLLLHYLFKKEGLESLPYLPDQPPKNLSYLPGFFEIKSHSFLVGAGFEPDIIFCLDYGDFRRLQLNQQFWNERRIITIDHHLESDQWGQIKIIEPEFSSTSEIIYHWLKYKNIAIDKEMAICLLTGIISDSGGFRHVCTSSETLNIVSELLLKGVSLSFVARRALAVDRPLNISQIWGRILSRTKLDRETGLAYSWITFEDFEKFKVGFADFGGIANLISAGSRVNLGLFLVEYEKGKIKGSLRSESHGGRNVAKIAKALGGGGHPYAAGFQQEGTIEEVLKKVINLIE